MKISFLSLRCHPLLAIRRYKVTLEERDEAVRVAAAALMRSEVVIRAGVVLCRLEDAVRTMGGLLGHRQLSEGRAGVDAADGVEGGESSKEPDLEVIGDSIATEGVE